MAGLSDKISNILGVPLPERILNQLKLRSEINSRELRDIENISYLQNKTSWVRLVSSVNVTDQNDRNYFKDLGALSDASDPSSLAKRFVLFGGTSGFVGDNNSYYYQPRSGILQQPSAYSPLGTREIQTYGYRPMPGIVDVSIETQGRLGSIRQAKINFKCWDKIQLDVIDTLYFKLGFTMFLEWGNTFFYSSKNPTIRQTTETYSSEINPFASTLFKEDIVNSISKLNRETEGNYDAMLGMVSNFNFSANSEGGYDCNLTLISLGILAESIKVNSYGSGNNVLTEALETYTRNFEADSLEKAKQILESGSFDVTLYKPNTLIDTLLNQSDPPKITYVPAFPSNVPKSEKNRANYLFTTSEVGNAVTRFLLTEPGSDYIIDAGNFGDQLQNNLAQIDVDKFKEILGKCVWSEYEDPKAIHPNLGSDLAKILFDFRNDSAASSVFEDLPYARGSYTGANGEKYTLDLYFDDSIKPVAGQGDFEVELDDVVWENLQPQIPNNVSREDITEIDIKEGDDFGIEFDTNQIFEDVVENEDLRGTDEEKGYQALKRFLSVTDDYLNTTPLKFGVFTDNSAPKAQTNVFLQFNLDIKNYVTIRDVDVEYKLSGTESGGSTKGINLKAPFVLKVYVLINDTYIIKSNTVKSASKQATGGFQKPEDPAAAAAADAEKAAEQPAVDQPQAPPQEAAAETVQDPISVMSSLEATLFAIKVHSLDKTRDTDFAGSVGKSSAVDLTEGGFHTSLFSNGVFDTFLSELVEGTIEDQNFNSTKNKKDKLKIGAKYGFATNLMLGYVPLQSGGKKNFYPVNYKDLLQSYVVGYEFAPSGLQLGTKTEKPVYISFGLLMMILNSNCTIYDTTDKNAQTPLIYIDFNPYHNLCLSCPQHLSVDPWTAMIPYEGGNEAYATLFPIDILTDDGSSISISSTQGDAEGAILFKSVVAEDVTTNGDRISGVFPSFHIPPLPGGELIEDLKISSFRGHIMNILLNIDYLAGIVRNEASTNDENKVFLKSFIEQILVDLNKCLGNFNTFRMSYNDGANCIQIVDDQLIPTSKEAQLSRNLENTDLPLYGLESIAKTLEIKTEISTRLSNMIAISANSGVKTANGTDATSYGLINKNLKDRFVSNRGDMKKSDVQTEEGAEILVIEDEETQTQVTNSDVLKELAVQFNSTIKSIYGPAANPSKDNVAAACNYYADQLAIFKATDPNVQSSGMIPVSINFSTDGISGIGMGHAFTVSDKILPYVYSNNRTAPFTKKYLNKVGFVIIGLSNKISNNVWTTSINSNMIFLKDNTAIDPGIAVAKVAALSANLKERGAVESVVSGDPLNTKDEAGNYAVWIKGKIIGYEPAIVLEEGGYKARMLKKYYEPFKKLQAAAKAAGHNLYLGSGFRTYDEQLVLRKAYAPKSRKNDMYYLLNESATAFTPDCAPPGYSNHQNGTAFDMVVKGRIPLFNWLKGNAINYGFVRTVPSERWHWEYIPEIKDTYQRVKSTHPSWIRED